MQGKPGPGMEQGTAGKARVQQDRGVQYRGSGMSLGLGAVRPDASAPWHSGPGGQAFRVGLPVSHLHPACMGSYVRAQPRAARRQRACRAAPAGGTCLSGNVQVRTG
eukprot:1734674-Rhodomonas_salina.1